MTSLHPDLGPDPAPGHQAPSPRRPATWPGRPAARPVGAYDPDPAVRDTPKGLGVHFAGEDGRTRVFSFATLPLPGWHADLAAAFASLTGSTGGLRTLSGAKDAWASLGRLVRFLDGLARPPQDVTRLTGRHLRRFEVHRRRTCQLRVVTADLRLLRRLLGEITPPDRLRPDVVDWLGRRWRDEQRPGTPGYSEQEFRRIMVAARHDVAAIRDRIRAGERLLARADTHPEALTVADRAVVVWLQPMARTGEVPVVRVVGQPRRGFVDDVVRLKHAKQLFLTRISTQLVRGKV